MHISLSCSLKEDSDSQLHCVGSPWWMAPEVIAFNDCNLNYDCRCDVWSLGITAIELADGHPPLENIHFNGVMLKTVRNPPPTVKNPRDWSQIFNDFINECLIWNFDYRSCVEELMKHPFLTQPPKSDTHVTVELQHLIQKTCKQSKPATFIHRVFVLGSWFVEAWDEEPKWLLIDDVAALHNVTEDAVIKHLGGRFKEHQFYTYCGDILISLNPFVMPNQLSEKFYPNYEGKTFSDNLPHLFAVSDRSYQDMLHHQCHQTIVLLGESGSGKSTAASWLLKHLVFRGTNVNPGVNEKLLQIFPILDAFGNARTSRNSSSSRCARHVELSFNRVGKITGATVFMYLLETWRITSNWPGNFNFYVFYYFYDGMRAAGHLKEFGLDVEGPQRHRYLWGMHQDHSDRNKKMFNLLLSSFVSLGFSMEEISTVWNCLAAIILLGDLQFVKVGLVTEVTNTKILEKIEDAVKKRNIIVRLLYSRLVDWVVNMITKQLPFSAVVYGNFHSISIADYHGFEDISNNSFEQLVSNMIAEQNIYHFNRHVFEKEMDDSKMEGIKYPDIQYGDNRPIMDLFLYRPGGILDVVHHVTRQPVTDIHIIESLKNTVSNIKFLADEGLVFVVKHTFDNVAYSVEGFVDKNCEQVPPEAILAFSCSINSKVKEMFTQPLTKTGNLSLKTESTVKVKENNRQRGLWVSSRGVIAQNAQANPSEALNLYQTFSRLLTHITKGSPHFVFCIQSNRQSKSNYFSYKDVQSQISSLNITNTAILKQKGYSHRIPFEEFLKRYQYLTFDFDEKVEITRENCCLLLLRLSLTGWHIGCTKVFMKYYHKEYLSHLYEHHVKKIVKIQALIRAFLARRKKLKEQNNICTNHVSKLMNSKGIDSQNYLHLASVTKENQGDKEAYIIQTYFKKWRIKTMFEELDATRNAEIIYFSQQVHLYNQETHHNLYQSQLAVDLIKVKPTVKGYMEALCHALPVRVPKSRTPLCLQDITFEDTSHMCETGSLSERNSSILSTVATEELFKMQEEWDTPLNKALPLRFNTKDLIKENISNNSLIPSTVDVIEETQHDDHNISIDQSQNIHIKPVKGPHKYMTVPHSHGEKPKGEFSSLRHRKPQHFHASPSYEKRLSNSILEIMDEKPSIKFDSNQCNENKPDTTIKTDAEPKTKAYDEDASSKTKMTVTESSMPCINVIKIEEFELMPGILMRGLSAEV